MKKALKNRYLDNILENLSEAMKDPNVSDVRAKLKGRILDSPWSRIPDCSELSVNVGIPSPIFAHYGIIKKVNTTITITPWKNGDMNRYLEHQMIRLKKCRDEGQNELYWHISWLCMKRSNTFRVSGISHVFNNWHRNYPLNFIMNVNRLASLIINQKLTNLEYKRVYIEKGEKGWRPLGVPRPEWRLFLHMLSNFITYFVSTKISHSQHGFLPGKGTLTCWAEILNKKVMDYPYVREWDFKSYFDTLSLKKLRNLMGEMGIPKDIVHLVDAINRSLIKLPEERKIDEKLSEERFMSNLTTLKNWDQKVVWSLDDFLDDFEYVKRSSGLQVSDAPNSMYTRNTGIKLVKAGEEYKLTEQTMSKLKDLAYDQNPMGVEDIMMRGVPQGSPTSPILGNIIMDQWLKSDGFNKIAYADDSLGYSKTKVEEKLPADLGVELNHRKCGWIKFAGRVVRPLKFLGLVFDGKELTADTRKGSKLAATDEIKEMLTVLDAIRYHESMTFEEAMDYIKSARSELLYSGKIIKGQTWEKWFASKIAGFIQSRLYLGDWHNPKIEQCFKYTYVRGSWSSMPLARIPVSSHPNVIHHLNVFNSSTFACWSLANLLRNRQKLYRNQTYQMEVKAEQLPS